LTCSTACFDNLSLGQAQEREGGVMRQSILALAATLLFAAGCDVVSSEKEKEGPFKLEDSGLVFSREEGNPLSNDVYYQVREDPDDTIEKKFINNSRTAGVYKIYGLMPGTDYCESKSSLTEFSILHSKAGNLRKLEENSLFELLPGDYLRVSIDNKAKCKLVLFTFSVIKI
jgi:hypothetical protein